MGRRTSILPAQTIGKIMNTPLEEHRKVLRKYSWLPDVFRIGGSVIPQVLGPVLTVTIFAIVVATADHHTGMDLRLSNNVVPLLSVVVGLLLVFRNGTSYDRYYEGRKDFATMTAQTRNLARLIWVNISAPPSTNTDSPSKPSAKTVRKVTKLKIHALKLLMAFPRSVMHHLRQENGSETTEMTRILTDQLKDRARIDTYRKRSRAGTGASRYGTVSGKETPNRSNSSESTASASKRHCAEREINQDTPLLVDVEAGMSVDIQIEGHPSIPNMPLTIAHELTRMIWKFKRAGMLDTVGPAGTNAMMTSVQVMVDMLTAMERVSNTPIPASYGIHLKQCVTLYLFALPFTLVKDMGYNMIPVVTVVAFTLMGIEGIADQIEMPFGKDTNDLPLETYCEEIQQDIEYVMDYLPQGDEEDGFMRDMPQDDEDDAITF